MLRSFTSNSGLTMRDFQIQAFDGCEDMDGCKEGPELTQCCANQSLCLDRQNSSSKLHSIHPSFMLSLRILNFHSLSNFPLIHYSFPVCVNIDGDCPYLCEEQISIDLDPNCSFGKPYSCIDAYQKYLRLKSVF